MRRKPFFWHIFPPFLFITATACTVIVLYALRVSRDFHTEVTVDNLKVRAVLLHDLFAHIERPVPALVDSLAGVYGRGTRTRITVIRPDGAVVGDSEEDPLVMDNHGDRPEIRSALRGDTGIAVRYSATLSRDLIYVALPLMARGELGGVIRTSVPRLRVIKTQSGMRLRIALAALIVLVTAVGVSLWLSRRLARPIIELTRGAELLAEGKLGTRLRAPAAGETARLCEAMNTMARQLSERIETITRRRNEQEAILSAMVEGVIAVDRDEHIIMINAAAGEMIGRTPGEAAGKWIQEAVRNVELQKIIQELLRLGKPLRREASAMVTGGDEKNLEVIGTVLNDPAGKARGVLVVLHDISELKRLENVRREFVANVSHELRTPLTSIKGFVETLLEGAMDNERERVRFLEIIEGHVNRLNAIIKDILTLSRLEKEARNGDVALHVSSLGGVVREAVEVCMPRAREKRLQLEMGPVSDRRARINPSLLEQAIINLIDNAIKYSDADTEVTVSCIADEENVRISVTDHGPGIPEEHLPRLFERFYRVEKARSRKLGGTGLGLSIVKHILNVHGGKVEVESRVGEGSAFTLMLPAVDAVKEKRS